MPNPNQKKKKSKPPGLQNFKKKLLLTYEVDSFSTVYFVTTAKHFYFEGQAEIVFNMLMTFFNRNDYCRFEILLNLIDVLFQECPRAPYKGYQDYFRPFFPVIFYRTFRFGIDKDTLRAEIILRKWKEAGFLDSREYSIIRNEIDRALRFWGIHK